MIENKVAPTPGQRYDSENQFDEHGRAQEALSDCGREKHPIATSRLAATIKLFAHQLKIPVSALLEQLKNAGVGKQSESNSLTDDDKSKLLAYLRRAHSAQFESAGTEKRNEHDTTSDSGAIVQPKVRLRTGGQLQKIEAPDQPVPPLVEQSAKLLAMQTILARYRIDGVWHFTDRSNLTLIQEHQGLLSLAELRRRRITVPVPGGNDWSHHADEIKGGDEYVHLAFLDDHPMLYVAKKESRITDPIWIKIDVSILLEDGARFTNDVSNKSGVEFLTPDVALDMIDFEVLFTRTDWTNPEVRERRLAAIKSEILIPSIVPINKILSYKNG